MIGRKPPWAQTQQYCAMAPLAAKTNILEGTQSDPERLEEQMSCIQVTHAHIIYIYIYSYVTMCIHIYIYSVWIIVIYNLKLLFHMTRNEMDMS